MLEIEILITESLLLLWLSFLNISLLLNIYRNKPKSEALTTAIIINKCILMSMDNNNAPTKNVICLWGLI